MFLSFSIPDQTRALWDFRAPSSWPNSRLEAPSSVSSSIPKVSSPPRWDWERPKGPHTRYEGRQTCSVLAPSLNLRVFPVVWRVKERKKWDHWKKTNSARDLRRENERARPNTRIYWIYLGDSKTSRRLAKKKLGPKTAWSMLSCPKAGQRKRGSLKGVSQRGPVRLSMWNQDLWKSVAVDLALIFEGCGLCSGSQWMNDWTGVW